MPALHLATSTPMPPIMLRSASQATAKSISATPLPLDRIAGTVRMTKGDILCHEGDEATACYRVVSGCVRLSKLLPDGRRHVIDFLFPGDFFGLGEASEHEATAEALEAGFVARYPRRQLEALAERDITACNLLRRVATASLSAAHARSTTLARLGAAERLAVFLLHLSERTGGGDTVLLPMSRTDIGDYLGLTIETVSRTLGLFKSRGMIKLLDAHRVALTGRYALVALADGDVPLAA
jgi:CRP/FNR family transcriptional regulator, anaerobic regulatory protein